jgi:hypothetical protein
MCVKTNFLEKKLTFINWDPNCPRFLPIVPIL